SARPLSAWKAGAISSARRISSVTTSRPSVRAVVRTSPISSTVPGLSALLMTANRRRPGTTSRNISRPERGSGRRQMQKFAAGKFHFDFPSPFTLFDHLVGGGEQRRWNVEAERLRGLEVDHQLVFGSCLDRQVGWSLLCFIHVSHVSKICVGYVTE